MVSIFDVAFPIVSLLAFALLTIPVFRLFRKTNHKTALTLIWFGIVFAVAFAAVANLAIQYYQVPIEQSYVNISLASTPNAPINVSSAFMVDGISVYMAIIMVAVSAVVLLYAIFYVNPAERPSERYFAIMLVLVAALIGAVCAGDLLTLFIFWEIAAAGSTFLMLFREETAKASTPLSSTSL